MLEKVHQMSEQFFEKPILNSPYAFPGRHWELDADGQPTNRILENRRRSDLITPVPKTKKQRQNLKQSAMLLGANDELSSEDQEYNPTPIINEIRSHVETWRSLPAPDQWLVTPTLAAPQVRRNPPVLLPNRSRRNRHLANGGRAQDGAACRQVLGPHQRRQ